MPYNTKEKQQANYKKVRLLRGKEIDARNKEAFRKKFAAMTDEEKEKLLQKRRAQSLKSYYKHKDKINEKAKGTRYLNTLKRYNLTLIQYNEILLKQNKKCAICNCDEFQKRWTSSDLPFAVDHCHKTNKIRGLLCDSCNVMLGHGHEDVDIFKNAINYLKNVQ